MHEAWSEKLTFLDSPSIVWIALFRNDIEASGRSYVRTMIGMMSWRYSSMLEPKVRKASKILV